MRQRRERLLALTVLGMLALNPPLLSLFSREERVFGVPLLFLYLFCCWLGFVILIGMITRRKRMEKN